MRGLVRVHRVETCSLVNGPGRRFVIWFQGCPLSCRGCFNQEARSFEKGELMRLEELGDRIFAADVHGVTLTGGEPFLQAEEATALLRECGRRGLDRLVYTGFHFKDLKRNILPGSREMLRKIDLLLDGPYREGNPPDGEWTGSGNQKVIPLSRAGMVMKRIRRTEYVEREYIISGDGETVLTGI